MTKTRKRLKAIKKDPHAYSILKALQSGGLFRWQKPVSKAESAILVAFAAVYGDAWTIASVAIFGTTMFVLYFGSTMCHAMIGQKYDSFFEVWDSIAIYALIAGTYTPFLLVNMRGLIGWTVFVILWSVTIFGAFMKIRNPRYQPRWMVLLYLLMGWIVLFIIPAMIETVSTRGMIFALAGGLSYSIGVLFYLWRRLKFSHAVWHLFVIAGSVFFFFAVLFGSILDYMG
jgi:hemolysin III